MNAILKGLRALKEEDHRRALYASMVFIMLMILFFLLVSLEEPDPPLQEVIIPIDMENIEIPEEFMEDPGGGGSQGGPSPIDQQVENSAEEQPTQQEHSVEVNAGNENGTNNGVNNEPQPDQSLGFNGNNGNDNGNGNGDGFGDGDGTNVGNGSGPNGDGVYNPSRKVVTPPTFNAYAQEVGKIALDIWVDENGNVTKVRYKESKSTSGDAYLISLATKAAKTMKYDKKPGAGVEHVGYQIFEFKKA
jgi:outer membrane biosynthesis protein TonB